MAVQQAPLALLATEQVSDPQDQLAWFVLADDGGVAALDPDGVAEVTTAPGRDRFVAEIAAAEPGRGPGDAGGNSVAAPFGSAEPAEDRDVLGRGPELDVALRVAVHERARALGCPADRFLEVCVAHGDLPES
jgi:hypothetical protein